ncbi:TPTE2, partial [Symbiodinium pilosum]
KLLWTALPSRWARLQKPWWRCQQKQLVEALSKTCTRNFSLLSAESMLWKWTAWRIAKLRISALACSWLAK